MENATLPGQVAAGEEEEAEAQEAQEALDPSRSASGMPGLMRSNQEWEKFDESCEFDEDGNPIEDPPDPEPSAGGAGAAPEPAEPMPPVAASTEGSTSSTTTLAGSVSPAPPAGHAPKTGRQPALAVEEALLPAAIRAGSPAAATGGEPAVTSDSASAKLVALV